MLAPPSKYSHPARINEALQHYWNELASNRRLPMEQEVSPEALGDLWSSCFLVRVADSGYIYEHLGSTLFAAYGDNLTGREITEKLLYPHPAALFATFNQVCRSMTPVLDDNAFTNSRGETIRYRSCVLPLGTMARDGVAYLLGGMKWKVFP